MLATNQQNSVIAQGGVAATAIMFFSESIIKMVPWLIIALPLIYLDLHFGIKAALMRNERIRFSTAFRRTFGKLIEYICWTVLASTMSLAFNQNWLEWIILGVVYLNELSSIIGNYLETKGLEISWANVWGAVLKIGGQKVGVDTEGIDPTQFVKPAEKKPRPRNSKGQFVSTKKIKL